MTHGDKQTSMCLFSTRIFSLVNYLFKLFAHLKKIGFFSFRYVVRAFSSKYESSVGYMVCRYFPQFAACLFTQGLLQSNHFSFLMKSSLTMFSFSGLCFFASYLLTLHRTWRHSDVLLCFLLEVVALRFDPFGVHSFFTQHVKYSSGFISLHVFVQLIRKFVKRLFFPHRIARVPLAKSVGRSWVPRNAGCRAPLRLVNILYRYRTRLITLAWQWFLNQVVNPPLFSFSKLFWVFESLRLPTGSQNQLVDVYQQFLLGSGLQFWWIHRSLWWELAS